MQRKDINPGAFAIDDVLYAEECTVLIRRAEDHGFELAPITTAKGFKVDLETRNNDRVIFDDFGSCEFTLVESAPRDSRDPGGAPGHRSE